jgi:hypothetical protein
MKEAGSMPEPPPKDGKWIDLRDLKKAIEDYYKEYPPPPGEYYALIVKVENPISGYSIVQKPV